jgi:prepilin-type N-terminal cleavage/methylation domain-containing protein
LALWKSQPEVGNKIMKKTAFTLIEILIVISIIAVLMSILLPVTKNAIEQSRKTRCITNLKQCSILISQYVNDYELGINLPTTKTAKIIVAKNTSVFSCLSDNWKTSQKPDNFPLLLGSYGYIMSNVDEDDWQHLLRINNNPVIGCCIFHADHRIDPFYTDIPIQTSAEQNFHMPDTIMGLRLDGSVKAIKTQNNIETANLTWSLLFKDLNY